MNNNGEKKTEEGNKIAKAEKLLKNGGIKNVNADEAWEILNELKKQNLGLTRNQKEKVVGLMDAISEQKNRGNLEKLQKGIAEKNKAIAAGTLGDLLKNIRFLSPEQTSELIRLKSEFMEIGGLSLNKALNK